MKKNQNIYDKFGEIYPMTKIFTYKNYIFVYDAKSNLLTQVTINDLEKLCGLNSHVDEYIERLKSNGVFIPGHLKKVVPNDDELKGIIEKQMSIYIPRKFVLEVTEECTLRCKYCFYSDENNIRKHSFHRMKKEVAFKAIDYYFKIYTNSISKVASKDRQNILKVSAPGISWWGGEPFTNIKLMKETKRYIESLPWKDFGIDVSQLVYSVVSNFTILTKEIEEFIVNTGLYLFVSLDGGKMEHDLNRVFIDEKGSFDIVINNIKSMIDRHPLFCKQKMIIQSVLAENTNHNTIKKFIENFFLINTKHKTILKYLSFPQKVERKYLPKSMLNIENSTAILDGFDKLLNHLSSLDDDFLYEMLEIDEINREFKDLLSLENSLTFDHPRGSDYHSKHFSCPIGIDNIFISSYGDIHICNKVDYSLSLGNIIHGIDNDKLLKLYSNYYSQFRVKCKNCWAFIYCKVCPANTLYKGSFSLPSDEECNIIRETVYLRIGKYIAFVQFENLYEKIKTYYLKNKELNFLTYEGPITINQFNYEKN